MESIRKAVFTLAVAALMALPSLALADSLTPASFSTTLGVGESTTITKTITINKGAATTSQIDVYFLADTTGSMGSAIANVKSSASTILSTLSAYGNVSYAVGEYKDYGDPYVYRLNTAMTANTANVQSGINAWSASGGGDGPEAQLRALTDLTGAGTGWRTDSKKIVVWFGDYYGHDPSGGATEASTIAALKANNIVVDALNVGYSYLDATGQATRIAAATGGTLYSGINTSAVAQAILDAIETETQKYKKVTLGLVGAAPAGVDVSFGLGFDGTYDRSIDRTFKIDVTFKGTAPGTYDFTVGAYLDGGLVGREADHIVVSGGTPAVPEPSTIFLLGAGLAGLGLCRRKFKK